MSIETEIDGQIADSQRLAKLLERVAELLGDKKAMEAELTAINKKLKEAEGLAVEALAASGLKGVRAAGKSWGTRETWQVSIPSENKAAVVEAARAEGLDDFISVNTSTLKTWLKERRGEGDGEASNLAAGTAFEGLISEYREVRLSHLTVG